MIDDEGTGASVARSGVAFFPDGEVIPVGSGLATELSSPDEQAVIQYHFPVEIEVRQAAEVDLDTLIDRVLGRLVQGLEGA